MAKSRDAFRTISEVADWLDTPAHVLRFWESKFSQVKPVKRAGGRRYYRPADMELLGGIKKLLHNEGMTIKGVQKVLREQGVKHVAALSEPAEDDEVIADAPFIEAQDTSETVVPFAPPEAVDQRDPSPEAPEAQQQIEILLDDDASSEPALAEALEPEAESEVAPPLPEADEVHVTVANAEMSDDIVDERGFETEAETPLDASADAVLPDERDDQAVDLQADDAPPDEAEADIRFAEDAEQSPLPAFLKEPLAASDAPQADDAAEEPVPPVPDLDAIVVTPGALTALARLTWLSTEDAEIIAPVLADLRDLQLRLTSPRK